MDGLHCWSHEINRWRPCQVAGLLDSPCGSRVFWGFFFFCLFGLTFFFFSSSASHKGNKWTSSSTQQMWHWWLYYEKWLESGTGPKCDTVTALLPGPLHLKDSKHKKNITDHFFQDQGKSKYEELTSDLGLSCGMTLKVLCLVFVVHGSCRSAWIKCCFWDACSVEH